MQHVIRCEHDVNGFSYFSCNTSCWRRKWEKREERHVSVLNSNSKQVIDGIFCNSYNYDRFLIIFSYALLYHFFTVLRKKKTRSFHIDLLQMQSNFVQPKPPFSVHRLRSQLSVVTKDSKGNQINLTITVPKPKVHESYIVWYTLLSLSSQFLA